MATPTYSEVISQINTFIVTNHNNEITANVLNPILVLLTDFTNNTIGDLDTLTTDQKDTIVAAINSLKNNFNDLVNNGVQLYTGMGDPNVTPPPTYKPADFYLQVDFDDLPVQLWQFNAFAWVLNSSDSNLLVQTVTDGDITHAPSGDAVFDALFAKADKAILEDHINNIDNPHNVTGGQIQTTPFAQYLTSVVVDGQLGQTEFNLISLFKNDKINFKDIYQTGLLRMDADVSVLSVSPADTLNITAVNNLLFINEIAPDVDSNKIANYLFSFGNKSFTANAVNTALAANTRGVFYVGVDKLGNQVYRTSKVYDQDVCYLARLIVVNTAGVYTIFSFKYFPDLANNRINNHDRFVLSSGYIVPSGAASISFGNRGVSYYKNSINYAVNKLDPNYLALPDSVNPAPMQFLFLLPNITSLATSIATSTVINPTQWYTAAGALGGTSVANANYQVYKLYVSVTGTLLIQTKASTSNAPAPGVNAIFATREDALAGLTSVVFPPLLPAGDSIALGTFYLRAGTAANGSQLSDPNDFYFLPFTSTSSSSTVGVTDHDLLSNKNGNPAFQHVTSADIGIWNAKFGGTGVLNSLAKFTGVNTVGASNITDVGTLVTVNSNTRFNGTEIIQGTTFSDGPAFGANLLTTGSGAGWSGTSYALGYTHTPGSITPLTSVLAPVTNNFYRINVTITGNTAGSLTMTLGGFGVGSFAASTVKYIKAGSTAPLVITPTTDFDGTVAVTVELMAASTALIDYKSSAGNAVSELRFSGAVGSVSTYFGLSTGRFASIPTANNNIFGSGNAQSILSSLNITSFGNNSLTALTNDSYVLAFGNGIFQTLRSTSANNLYNIGIGGGVGAALSSGQINTFIGFNIALNATTASFNLGIGYMTFNGLTVGQNNVGLAGGSASGGALYNNTTGSKNIGIGNISGKFIADGIAPNTITNNSIFIGEDTRALADNQINQIVIGFQAIGQGSNSVQLGNSAITKFAHYGQRFSLTVPPTSAGTFDFVTRNIVTGAEEKVLSTSIPLDSNVVHKDGAEDITGVKTFVNNSAVNTYFVNQLNTGQAIVAVVNNISALLSIGINGSTYAGSASYGVANDVFIRASATAGDLNLISANKNVKIITNNVERLRVDSDGNIGINGGNIIMTQTISGVSSSGSGLILRNNYNSNNYDAQIVPITEPGGAASSGLLFRTASWNGSAPQVYDRMYIDALSGNVGIGNNAPAFKLDVTGNINASGNLTLGGGGFPGSPISVFKPAINENGLNQVMAKLLNTNYSSTNSGVGVENSLVFGWSNHYAASLTAYKPNNTQTGFKIYTEDGYNNKVLHSFFTPNGQMGVGGNITTMLGKFQTKADNINIAIESISDGLTAAPVSRRLSWLTTAPVECAYIDVPDERQNTNAVSMRFYTKDATNVLAERMRITTEGTLKVVGNVQAPTFNGVKRYKATLTQTGTAAPVVVRVTENTIGAIVWSYSGVGLYDATLTGAFTVNKTDISFSNNSAVSGGAINVVCVPLSDNVLQVQTYVNTTLTNSVINKILVVIEVYP